MRHGHRPRAAANPLYVALTRARRRLVLVPPPNQRIEKRVFEFYFPSSSSMKQRMAKSRPSRKRKTRKRRKSRSWRKDRYRSTTTPSTRRGETNDANTVLIEDNGDNTVTVTFTTDDPHFSLEGVIKRLLLEGEGVIQKDNFTLKLSKGDPAGNWRETVPERLQNAGVHLGPPSDEVEDNAIQYEEAYPLPGTPEQLFQSPSRPL